MERVRIDLGKIKRTRPSSPEPIGRIPKVTLEEARDEACILRIELKAVRAQLRAEVERGISPDAGESLNCPVY